MKTSEVFVSNLRRLRKAKFSSQETFAAKVDLSERGYQKYEQGESSPTPDILDRFAKVLGCEPWELTKPVGAIQGASDLVLAAELLSKLVDLPPARRGFVLALIFRDERYIVDLSKEFHQAYRALLKVP